MLISLLPVPFADAARQRQFEAVAAALQGETPATVLLGNLAAFAGFEADALLVRPHYLALLVLTPRAGRLTIPALTYGSWQLDGQALPGRAESDNPFAFYQQQQPDALAWLSAQWAPLGAALPPCTGLALFEAPLTFGPEVEARLQHADAPDFHLVGGVEQLPQRLHQLAATPAPVLSEQDLLEWAHQLAAELASPQALEEEPATNYLTQKLQQLWSWLGAEDIPADPPYGSSPTPVAHLRDEQEQARLQHLRHELQAELHQQRQEAAAREAARTQELAQLRQQLAQAGLSATERRAEQQATATLEEELRTARAELASRHQELDARIQQLGLFIKQLQTADQPAPPRQPAPGVVPAPQRPAPALPAMRSATVQKPSFRRLRQAERWGILTLALAGAGAGAWAMLRLTQPKAQATMAMPRRHTVFQHAEQAVPTVVYVVDSTLAGPAPADTATTSLHQVDSEPAATTVPAEPAQAPAAQPADSATNAAPTPTTAPDSTTATSPTP